MHRINESQSSTFESMTRQFFAHFYQATKEYSVIKVRSPLLSQPPVTSIKIAVFVLFFTFNTSSSNSTAIKEADHITSSGCEEKLDCGSIDCPEINCLKKHRSPCECCEFCIRDFNQSCDAPMDKCADHLECTEINGDDDALKSFRCTYSKQRGKICPNQHLIPECEWDSTLVTIDESVDHSNSPCKNHLKFACKCNFQMCYQNYSDCDQGFGRILIAYGNGQPGKCCDQYECRKLPSKCENIRCTDFFSETMDLYSKDGKNECPDDSYRPLSYFPEGSCCPIFPQCTCRPDICPSAQCPPEKRLVIERKGTAQPGSCCDVFRCEENEIDAKMTIHFSSSRGQNNSTFSCYHDGVFYQENQRWYNDHCESCSCSNGVALCSWMECPNVAQCGWVGKGSEFECCPTCLGCRNDEGSTYKVGDHWQKDECTQCSCSEDYQWQCQKYACKTECENPQKIHGHCCPVCNDSTIIEAPILCPSLICSLNCENGLAKNEWGCYECRCSEPEIAAGEERNQAECIELTSKNCNRECELGFAKDSNGCTICKCECASISDSCYKHCLYGFQVDQYGCQICKCRSSNSLSPAASQTNTGISSDSVDDSCFSTLKNNKHQLMRDDGEWWTDGSRCKQCFCQRKKVFCSLIACPSRPLYCAENKWIRKKNQCCATCQSVGDDTETIQPIVPVCHSPGTGRIFAEGETWQLDSCISCTCSRGHVLCSTEQCPPLPCENPIKAKPGNCCQTCLSQEKTSADDANIFNVERFDKSENEQHRCLENIESAWREDECTSCRCSTSGITKCYSETCDMSLDKCPTGKWLMIHGKCCPICSETLSNGTVCIHGEKVHQYGEEFRDGPCKNCTCKADNVLECIEFQCSHCGQNFEHECCSMCDRRFYSFNGAETRTIFIKTPEDQTIPISNPHTLHVVMATAIALGMIFCIFQVLLIRRVLFRKQKKTILPCISSAEKKLVNKNCNHL